MLLSESTTGKYNMALMRVDSVLGTILIFLPVFQA